MNAESIVTERPTWYAGHLPPHVLSARIVHIVENGPCQFSVHVVTAYSDSGGRTYYGSTLQKAKAAYSVAHGDKRYRVRWVEVNPV